MDLSSLRNPYDFANPVADLDLFIGRTAEMDEIRYYLDQATKAARPINLALIGPRASGKTSVLNMIHHEAEKRGFCVVRLNLDEADAQTQLAFFYKIFDSMLTTACECGAFGGLNGRTYGAYRDMVDAHEITEEKEFRTFVFPMQYARAMGKGNPEAPLSDAAFGRDISIIGKELNRPFALLFDEGDVLAKSRVHLEKLRNIFMNVPGFMLVLTGTPALFPLMDDVFSPIVRQFKKIGVGSFKDADETRKCIEKPLQKIGVAHVSDVFDPETYLDVSEIHELCGGRPYEVQLICHFLFRRVQEGRSKRMELTLDVLDDVQRELETSQDIFIRPILTAVRNCNKEQLWALSLLVACGGRATFEQVWFSEYFFRGEERWSKEQLEDHLGTFEELGVVKVDDNIISFAGDDFDRIYCKYLTRKHGVPLVIEAAPYDVHLMERLDSFVLHHMEGPRRPVLSVGWVGQRSERPGVHEVSTQFIDEREDVDPFASSPHIAEAVYWMSMNFRGKESFQLVTVTLSSPWASVRAWYQGEKPSAAAERETSDIASVLEGPLERAAALGGNATVETESLPVVPIEMLTSKVERSDNARARGDLSRRHSGRMITEYVENRDVDEALFHGELMYRYGVQPEFANNLGYLFSASGDIERARELLKVATEEDPEKPNPLPLYNLAVVEAKDGNLKRALEIFKLAIQQSEALEQYERGCSCLFLPKISDTGDALEFEEIWNPDLLETAQAAASVVEKLLRKKRKPKGTQGSVSS